MPKVTEAHLEARRSQILDAAWECFARKGYHSTTMQDICEEASLSPGALYRYFDSKEDLLAAINARSRDMSLEIVEEIRSQASGPLDTLNVLGSTMSAVFEDPMFETTTRVNIEIWPEILRNKRLRESLRQEMGFWRTVVSQLLAEAQEMGQLRADVDPEALAVTLICAWDGLRHYHLLEPTVYTPERLVELMRMLVTEEAPRRGLDESRRASTRIVPPLRSPSDGGQRKKEKKNDAPTERARPARREGVTPVTSAARRRVR